MNNSYLLTYCYEEGNGKLGIGSVTMTQKKYIPINQSVIDEALRIVRNDIGLPEELKLVPLGFCRFETEEKA